MKNIVYIFLVLALVSCSNKEVLLPQVDRTIVATVEDHSPIYMFFETKGNDTLVDLNRKNSISSTNWIFNIDKRLPLKLVIPEVIKMQAKKSGSMHKNAESQNYFSYSDSIHKKLAFVPFTKIKYVLGKPQFGIQIYFSKNDKIIVIENQDKSQTEVKKEKLFEYLLSIPGNKANKYIFCHELKSNYQKFIRNNVYIAELQLQIPVMNLTNEEYIY
jgi:hypothetical protein